MAQVTTTASIAGVVKDASGAAIPGAEVTVENQESGAKFQALTNDAGAYEVPALRPGVYRVTVSVPSFKTAVVPDVRLNAGVPATVNVNMEVGQIAEQITVVGGAEVLQTQSSTVATTIQTRQITELPFVSRDALDLALLLPGTSTPGRPRTSSIQGLPKGALNITMDGVNTQDQTLKSSDGFFTYIRPRTDAIEEVTVSSNNLGADSSGEGAVQLKFVTRSGSNEFHGSAYEYLRNTALNANYYFNNIAGLPRQLQQLNQFGGRVGGPIIKNKLLFFANYEEYRLPEAYTRQRTILSPDAEKGILKYPGGPAEGVNVLSVAAANGFTSTLDPVTGQLIQDTRQSTSAGFVEELSGTPWNQRFSFTNKGGQVRRFPTVRFDWNITEKHHLENIWNFQDFASKTDFLNGADPVYPGGQSAKIYGSQASNRYSDVIGYRYTISPRMVNEARLGLVSGTTVFFPEFSPSWFGPYGNMIFDNSGTDTWPLMTAPNALMGNERRNAPTWQFTDSLHWTKGSHNFTFGGSYTQVKYWGQGNYGALPVVNFGMSTNDPVDAIFTPANFPNATDAYLQTGRNLYALLTGLVLDGSQTAYLDENSKEYELGNTSIARNRQREFGIFGQDSWKMSPSFTLNYGLRWEVQFPYVNTNEVYSYTTFDGLYGSSGVNGLFKPGSTGGSPPTFSHVTKSYRPYDVDWKNFGPSVGFAWTPGGSGFMGKLFGTAGQSVIRAGYSMAFNREGMNNYMGLIGANPGLEQLLSSSVDEATLPVQTYFRNLSSFGFEVPPPPSYPFAAQQIDGVNAYAPNLGLGYIQSWNVAYQRELTRDSSISFTYMANRGVGLWRQINLNEANIFENGFLDEFKQAQANRQINISNGKGNTFANNGLPGQAALPIYEASFGSATSSRFKSSTFLNQLIYGTAGAAANSLAFNGTYQNNRIAGGYPENLFVVNPEVLYGGSYWFGNGRATKYDALSIQFNRRMSKGLLVQGSYDWAKASDNMWASSSVSYSAWRTMRATALNRGPSPWNVAHSLKAAWIWELPVGPGRGWTSGKGVVNKLVEGWEFHGTARMNTGRPTLLLSGRNTVNQYDGGVLLQGMNLATLQDMGQTRRMNGRVYLLPQPVINNTLMAMGRLPGTPEGEYIAPPSEPGVWGGAVFVEGPPFGRADLSVVKRTFVTESVNVEFRAEFLNAFNNINFLIGGASSDTTTMTINSNTFGQTSNAYQDLSTTNDPGGRMVQFVVRVNF